MDADVLWYSPLSQPGWQTGNGDRCGVRPHGFSGQGTTERRDASDPGRSAVVRCRWVPRLSLEYYSNLQPESTNPTPSDRAQRIAWISPGRDGCRRGRGRAFRSARSARSSACGCHVGRKTPSGAERRYEESGSPVEPRLRREMKVVSCFLKSARVPAECQTAMVRVAVQRRAGRRRGRRSGRRPSAPGRRRPG
jgi:hypothetical protein